MPPIPPSQTLFVKNLNPKVKKPELQRSLHSLFSSYGSLLDVVATRAEGMRGQAFLVFKDLAAATAAMRGLSGFEFYDKPLFIEYARTKSRVTLGPEAIFQHKLAESERRLKSQSKVTTSRAQAEAMGRERKRQREEAGQVDDSDQDEPESKTQKRDGNVLVSSELPESVNEDMLGVLFQQHPGFVDVKLQGGTAHITYQTSQQATEAQVKLDGFKLSPKHTLSILVVQ